MLYALVNGKEADSISLSDRGLHYGDGLAETVAVRNGKPKLLKEHMRRLMLGLDRLKIKGLAFDTLRLEINTICEQYKDGIVKVIITRGAGGRGYDPAGITHCTRIVAWYDYPERPAWYNSQGIAVHICKTTVAENPLLAGVKHLNRLEQVLARAEWSTDAYAEGLMLDQHGHVIEGTMSNLFFVADNVLRTPDIARCGVAGIMRDWVLREANKQTIKTEVADFTLDDLYNADEVFMTNSIIGLWPVVRVGEQPFSIGLTTKRLQAVADDIE